MMTTTRPKLQAKPPKISELHLGHARHKPTPQQVVFAIPKHPPSVAQMATDSKIAMDDNSSIGSAASWAQQSYIQSYGLLGAGVAPVTFLGYAYLAELAQRPEYRVLAETLATEMTRRWIRFTSTNEDGDKKEKKIKELQAAEKKLKVRDLFARAAQLDAFFGRGHIYIDTGDTDDRDELAKGIGDGWDEISKSKISKKKPIRALRTVEPVWTYPTSYNSDDPLKDNWYRPDSWMVQGKLVHSSRLLTFVGREVPDLLKPTYSFGGLSMSQLAMPYVNNWLETRQGVNDIVQSFSTFVLSTTLAVSLQADGDQLFKRAELFNNLRDNRGLMMLDKETEDFKNVSAPISGLHELQAQAQEHMCSVSRTPGVKLLGIQPSGMNATSEGELRSFYDYVNAWQEHLFRSPLKRILGLIMLSLWGEVDDEIDFEFVELWALDEKGEAELKKAEAEVDQILIDAGVLHPEESRARIASDADSPYASIDVDDVPDLREEEEEGLEPQGGRPDDAATGEGAAAPAPEAKAPPAMVKGKKTAQVKGKGAPQAQDAGWEKVGRNEKGQFKSGGGSAKSMPAAHEAPSTAGWKRVGKQMGSNPGGVFKDETGKDWYLKQSKSEDHAKNEDLANRLYRALGVPVLDTQLIKFDGNKLGTAAPMEKIKPFSPKSAEDRKAIQEHFAAHAFLSNWDAIGLENDNQAHTERGMTTVDAGGSLNYRAQGGPKGAAFGDKVGEWDTLRSPQNHQAHSIFGSMSEGELRDSAKAVVKLPDATIREMVMKHGPGDEMARHELASKMIARKRDIAKRAGLTIAADEKTFREEDVIREDDGKFGGMKSKGSAKAGHLPAKLHEGEHVTHEGKPLPDHIKKLGKIPPAWTDVTYSPDPKSAVQVAGKDAKGRVQAIYSAEHTAAAAAAKFARIHKLDQEFDGIYSQNEKARKSKDEKTRAAADCARLIMMTGIRPGSEDDTGAEKQAYGATTLEGKHVVVKGNNVSLVFTGKKGVDLNIPVEDHETAQMLIARKKAAGPNKQLFPISEAHLLDHVHGFDGGMFRTKDFRTLLGTKTAMSEVSKMPTPKNEAEYKKAVKAVAVSVSKKLGNTPSVALTSYISPTVFAAWRIAA